jgi:DnaJ like chaperone protein
MKGSSPVFRAAKVLGYRFFWAGPLVGGMIGAMGGIIGAAIGLVMGYLVQELVSQLYTDTAVRRYLENPGRSAFYEGEPGAAAYCALGIYIVFQETCEDEGLFIEQVVLNAAEAFPRGRKLLPLLELFCRLAASRRRYLNPDLLAESLCARRKSRGDLPKLGERLESLALNKTSQGEAAYIRSVLDPAYKPGTPEREAEDPWTVLGLKPGTPQEKVKAAFRKLAIRYHPDVVQNLDKKGRENATLTFITIKEAYRAIMRAPREESRETRFS